MSLTLEEWKKTHDIGDTDEGLLFSCWHMGYRVGAEQVTPIVANGLLRERMQKILDAKDKEIKKLCAEIDTHRLRIIRLREAFND